MPQHSLRFCLRWLPLDILESVLESQALPVQEAEPFRHGAATFLAFVTPGFVPLVPDTIPPLPLDRFASSILLTMLGFFTVGALRSMLSYAEWWRAGLEIFALGAITCVSSGRNRSITV